ncbi:response regulator transcription factor [Chitinophaga deserti]|uniref:response regulator transcription factor n=1 Tax=Chitinophaga deserti TaxID=2164099 RepID=UPI000D6CD543|nr:response regulator transcription factor [Chitinophaga deserti]
MTKVLIVEDEVLIAREMEQFLRQSRYHCDIAYTAAQALLKLEDNSYDFLLLDLGLPDKDGLALLYEAKKDMPDLSCIILSARGQVEDRIRGLDLGADDYLPKPFSLPELHARMQAVIRRKYGLREKLVSLGEFQMDLGSGQVLHEGTAVPLSKKETDVLSYLLLHKNRPITRMQLSEHIWGSYAGEDYDSNYIDVHIKNIRKKLAAKASTEWLQTIRNIGYKICV